jgi:putative endonuclease
MSQNQDTGIEGEDIAVEYLIKNGYYIVSRNVKVGFSELDIIARKENVLVFVEVRLRDNAEFGFPEQTMSPAKIKAVKRGAEDYLFENDWEGEIRFDFISVLLRPDFELLHFKDAFF